MAVALLADDRRPVRIDFRETEAVHELSPVIGPSLRFKCSPTPTQPS
jgi:hypothetical protein